jgi:predicted nucleotidyltransferase
MTLKSEIDPYLRTIEYEYGINIIGAWDRGSRAWDLHTDKSDYDIRICYTQPYSNYLTISRYTESIKGTGENLSETLPSSINPNKIEFQGWDIKRFIELLSDDNPSIFECLASPITYQHHPIFADLADYCLERIHPINLWRHYYSATKKNYKKYIKSGSDTSAKKHLFIFRNILCAQHIRYTHTFPTIDYDTLLNESPKESFEYISKQAYKQLAEIKRNGNGNQTPQTDYSSEIESFIQDEIQYKKHIPDETIQDSQLDEYLLKIIQSSTMFM